MKSAKCRNSRTDPLTLAGSSRRFGAAFFGVAVTAVAGATIWVGFHQCRAAGNPDPSPAGAVTFNKDIAPVVFRNCSGCHRPGQVAPFNLLTWAEVRKHAREIVEVTE